MKCDKVREYLPFINDGTLEKGVVDSVKAHLEKCSECRREYTEVSNTLGLVKSAFAEYKSQTFPDISIAVRNKINSRKKVRKVRYVYSFAAVLMMGMFISMYGLFMGDSIENGSYQMAMADYNEEVYGYFAEQYLDAFELYELVEDPDIFYEYSLEDVMLEYDYLDVTVDDIIQSLDIEEMSYLLSEM